jgi:hypothetical protein
MKKFLRIILYLLANLFIVLGAVYITFTILDQFNPMLLFIEGNVLTRYLYIVIPALAFVFGILYIIYYWMCRKKRVSKAADSNTHSRDSYVSMRSPNSEKSVRK